MLDISPEMAQYKDRIGNYPLNLLEVRKIEDLEQFQGELKGLLGFVKHQKDRAALNHFVDQNEEMFRNLSAETAVAMSVLGNSWELQRHVSQIEKEPQEEEVRVDMCQAIREMIEDGRKEGREEGRKEGLKEGLRIGSKKVQRKIRKVRREIRKEANRMNRLNLRLLDDGRLEDLRRSIVDKKYQQALYQEYGL